MNTLSKTIIALSIGMIAMGGFAQGAPLDMSKIPEGNRFAATNKTSSYAFSGDLVEMVKSKKAGEKIILLDIRSHPEAQYVGIPVGMDALVPWSNPDLFKWNDKGGVLQQVPNPEFIHMVEAEVQKAGLSKTDKIVIACRSGERASKAADALDKAGFTGVVSIVDGLEGVVNKDSGKRDVNGWRNQPEGQWSLKPSKEYFRALK
jgi:rhodanese-related sulfurtransferase